MYARRMSSICVTHTIARERGSRNGAALRVIAARRNPCGRRPNCTTAPAVTSTPYRKCRDVLGRAPATAATTPVAICTASTTNTRSSSVQNALPSVDCRRRCATMAQAVSTAFPAAVAAVRDKSAWRASSWAMGSRGWLPVPATSPATPRPGRRRDISTRIPSPPLPSWERVNARGPFLSGRREQADLAKLLEDLLHLREISEPAAEFLGGFVPDLYELVQGHEKGVLDGTGDRLGGIAILVEVHIDDVDLRDEFAPGPACLGFGPQQILQVLGGDPVLRHDHGDIEVVLQVAAADAMVHGGADKFRALLGRLFIQPPPFLVQRRDRKHRTSQFQAEVGQLRRGQIVPGLLIVHILFQRYPLQVVVQD